MFTCVAKSGEQAKVKEEEREEGAEESICIKTSSGKILRRLREKQSNSTDNLLQRKQKQSSSLVGLMLVID